MVAKSAEFELHHLSHSALTDLLSCGEKYRLRRIEKVPTSPSWALIGGSAFHAATEALDKRDFDIPCDLPLTFAECMEEVIAEAEQRSPTPQSSWRASGRASKEWPEKEDKKWWLAHGQIMVDNWRAFLKNSGFSIWVTPDGQPAIELRGEVSSLGFPFVGYIDRILVSPTHSIGPVDLKSGKPPRQNDQLIAYGLMIEEVFGVRPTWGAYYMSRSAGLGLPVALSALDRKPMEHRISSAAKQIKEKIFIPNQSPLCFSCDVRDYCYQEKGKNAGKHLPW